MTLTQDQFVARSRAKHGARYDYSRAAYRGAGVKMEIVCPTHGAFWQTPRGHISGKGCAACGLEKRGKSRRLTREDFVARAQAIHPGLYGYSQVIYRGMFEKSNNPLPDTQRLFSQTPDNHLSGEGCPACGLKRRSASKSSNAAAKFQARAEAKHPDKRYGYSRVNYISARMPVEIICPTHGSFRQTPDNHLHGKSCPLCAAEATRRLENPDVRGVLRQSQGATSRRELLLQSS